MYRLTRLSLKNRAVVLLLTVLVIAAGLFAAAGLKKEIFPAMSFPARSFYAVYSGASPQQVERDVAVPVETALRGVPGVTDVQTTVSNGVAQFFVQFGWNENAAKVERAMEKAATGVQVPKDVKVTMAPDMSGGGVPIILSFRSDLGQEEASQKIKDVVVPRLSSLDGAGQVQVSGLAKKQISITLRDADLAKNQVAMPNVVAALSALPASMPVGTVKQDAQSIVVSVGKELEGIAALKALPIKTESAMVTLEQVADVVEAPVQASGYGRVDGKQAQTIIVMPAPGSDTVKLDHLLRDAVPQLEKDFGNGAHFSVVFSGASYIEKSLENLLVEGAVGLVMAILVIVIFIWSARSTIVTAVSIPLSLLIALIGLGMDRSGTLNLLTLSALTVAIGRVVDDAIVVIENVRRHQNLGEKFSMELLVTSVKEVASAITASTLTTMAVYLPLGFVGGMFGELFRPFAVTIAVALGASLIVSLTVIPVLAWWFMKPSAKSLAKQADAAGTSDTEEAPTRLQRAYLPALRWSLKRPIITLLVGTFLLVGSFALTPLMKFGMLGGAGDSIVFVRLELKKGTTLEETDKQAKKIEDYLAGRRDTIDNYSTTVGSEADYSSEYTGGEDSANKANLTVILKAGHTPKDEIPKIKEDLVKRGGWSTELSVHGTTGAGGSEQQQVRIQGRNVVDLEKATTQLVDAMKARKELDNVKSDMTEKRSFLSVVAKPEAAKMGLNDQALAGIIALALRGMPQGSLNSDNATMPIVVTTKQVAHTTQELEELVIAPNPAGGVKLKDVATLTTSEAPATINRFNGVRTVSITATPAKGVDVAQAGKASKEAADSVKLPTGVSTDQAGAAKEQAEAFGQLGLALLAAVLLVVIILMATFRSVLQTIILLVSIPFAAIGAIVGLVVSGVEFGIPAMIGLLMLVGIVVTNAIVLIDLVNQYRERGMSVKEAVLHGARLRLRPILMTALATIMAMLPMAVGLTGGGMFISQSLAIVVIGGLVSSTLLTLIIVPALFNWIIGARERKEARRLLPMAPEPAPRSL